jgi:hypothetical protein
MFIMAHPLRSSQAPTMRARQSGPGLHGHLFTLTTSTNLKYRRKKSHSLTFIDNRSKTGGEPISRRRAVKKSKEELEDSFMYCQIT